MGTSAYDLSENAIDFVDALTREGGSDPAELFHYFSNMLINSAGVIFGVTGIAGGIGGLKNQCFVEETQIKTEDGNKNIEEIEKGDKVYSSNPETGETDLKEVKQVFVNEAYTIVHIKISDEEETAIESIDTTENHPFYVVDYGFKYASELKIGDEIKSLSGDIYSISEVSVDRLKVPIHVYNFEVEDWHTYYVSEAGVLVHNLCKTTPNTTTEASTQGSAAVGEGGSVSSDNVYDGVKQASKYLKEQGVPRQYRKQILESFDVRTIKLEKASENTYGLRFYGGNASAEGRYLFETFSPLTNRENLALPYEWNSMTDIQQFQVKNGTTIITGKAAPQTGFGAQYTGGANQWYINNLEDLIKCH